MKHTQKNLKRFHTTHIIEKSLRHHVVEWLATAMSIWGAILNAQLNIWGFYVFMVGNVFWVSFSIKHKHWGLLMTQIVFFALNIYGVYIWASTPLLK